LLRVWRETDRQQSLKVLLRPAYFIPEAKKLDALLAEMQSKRIHMAVVIDEYGGVSGLVTLEDIVEEILGEIQDEYDQGEEAPYQMLSDGGYLFLGRVSLADINEILGSNLDSEEADTLGGYIYSRVGRVPSVGDQVLVTNSLAGASPASAQPAPNLVLTVEQVSARRIRKVSARWVEAITGQEKDSEHVDG
jgi:CBS domain containing-hemolysin-like protein